MARAGGQDQGAAGKPARSAGRTKAAKPVKAAKAAAGGKPASGTKASKAAKAAAPGPGRIATWQDGKSGSAALAGPQLGDRVKLKLLREAVRMYEANARAGTHSTKTRGETNYTTRKPYKQKGTGNARRGDFNSPLLRGGGVTFGPRPRDYSYALPRRALREALRTALFGKLRDEEVGQMSSQGFAQPSTRKAAAALAALGCDRRALVVVPGALPELYKSFRNIPGVAVVPAADVNAHQVLLHDRLVLVDDAWDVLMARLGDAPAVTGAEEEEAGS